MSILWKGAAKVLKKNVCSETEIVLLLPFMPFREPVRVFYILLNPPKKTLSTITWIQMMSLYTIYIYEKCQPQDARLG